MSKQKARVHYVYKTTSQFWLYDDRAVVHINKPVWLMVAGPFIMAAALAVFIFSIISVDMYFVFWSFMVFILGSSFTFYNKKIEIYPFERESISKTYLNKRCISRKKICWDEYYTMKFIILKNDYGVISGVSLILLDSQKKRNIPLKDFSDDRFFFIFHKKFNDHFPDFKINECFDI